MTVEVRNRNTVIAEIPRILNEMEECIRAANEAATNARLAAEAVKRAKEAEAKAKDETREAIKRAKRAAREAMKAKKVEAKLKKKADLATRERVKLEAEDARQRARQEVEDIMKRARKETEEVKNTEAAETLVKEETEWEPPYRTNGEADQAKHGINNNTTEAVVEVGGQAENDFEEVPAELYSGVVRLALGRKVDYESVQRFQLFLSQVQNLRIISVGGSVREGSTITVSAEKPIPLLSVLRKMPLVRQVVNKGGEIQIELEARQ